MPQAIVRIRLDRLERRVDELAGLREALVRMESQFSQLREEIRVAVSALDGTGRPREEKACSAVREQDQPGSG